jgi:hypothetical protein
MSSSIWTPDALSSNARPASGRCWRIVEAQHRVSTLKLTDTAEEQDRLEQLLEESKPPVPPECRHLHFLLFTPFRYGPYPAGSRFRRAGLTPGIFYGSELPETAVAEKAFYRLLFYAESPATTWPRDAGEFTAFAVEYASGRSIDCRYPPLDAQKAVWADFTNYAGSQQLCDVARDAGIEIVKYESVRRAERSLNMALLTCRAFARSEPVERQSWRLHLSASGVRAICDFPRSLLFFDRTYFAADPRIAGMSWDRSART